MQSSGRAVRRGNRLLTPEEMDWILADERFDGLRNGWLDGSLDGWMDGWLDGWMDGWMNI